MVPSGWKLSNFKDINVTIVDGDRGKNYPKKSEYLSEGFCLFLGADNIRNGSIDLTTKTFITEKKHNSMNKGVVQDDDLILVMRGNGTGRIALYSQESSPYRISRINSGLVIIRIDQNKLNKFFALQLMQSDVIIKQFERFTFGSAQPQLTVKILRTLLLPTPPLPEQQKIAKILAAWDKAINTTERLIDNGKQQKKALMQQLLTGQKRLVDDSGQRFSGDWEEVHLSDLGSTFNGLTGKTKVDFGSGEKYIPYMNIFKNTFIDTNNFDLVNLENNERQNKVQFGDIFFTTSSETPEEVGMSSVFISNTQEDIYLNSFCFGFRPKSLEKISPLFIGYILRSSKIRRNISILAQGSTRFNLSKTQLMKIAIPLPSLKEQQKIADVLTNASREIEVLEQQLSDLQQEKKALMQQLLTGKKRVLVD